MVVGISLPGSKVSDGKGKPQRYFREDNNSISRLGSKGDRLAWGRAAFLREGMQCIGRLEDLTSSLPPLGSELPLNVHKTGSALLPGTWPQN